ncbi:kinase-like protein [Lentinus tigrinus ALCF2SS1-7]|uniref:kinase-like protein n=1 Tax=Lentinus tigrinus ALCF2SS1-7 TaxID=1328758 RepID=UPI0011662001|nr:kinase-like protein [Lentinus tigrinus ALCF2SS1-7]
MTSVADHKSRKFIGAVEDEWQLYSNNASDYTIGPPIGFGASSIVYAATYQPSDGSQPIPCALKVLDLDRLPPSALRLLQNETQLMSLSKHPNVLRVRGTWVDGHKLYIAMRLMNAGSVADVMRYQWQGGLEEEVIRCILKQALQGLNYFHINGLIHRDVKAANLLIDDDGTVLLGDLGVAAFLWDSEGTTVGQSSKSRTVNFGSSQPHNHQRNGTSAPLQRPTILGKRKSFVGTPCWMAPEVINGKQYDASADIWSFGITAIELAQGRAPRSRLDPHKVLLMTVTEEPPKLERNSGPHRYSSAFAEIVAMCLTKNPSKRPTAAELLQTSFFRNARKPSYLCSTILRGLPPLTQRQERRKQPSILTHTTIDSWDFSPSLPSSPTTSVLGHVRRPKSLLPPESVFEMEDDQGDDADSSHKPANGTRSDGDDDEGDHAGIDGHSRAEAYVVRIRERHRDHHGRLHLHSRSSSYHSHHSHHSHSHSHHHSRHCSHEEPRSTVHSIQEVIGQEVQSDESSDTDRDQEREAGAQGIPVAVSPTRTEHATLAVPSGAARLAPSTSPCSSSHSSTSMTSSTSSPVTPSTPPLALSMSSGKSQRGKLWRKLAGKADTDTEKEKERETSPRKRSFGAVLGRTAHMSADLVRTASRTMSSSKQTR